MRHLKVTGRFDPRVGLIVTVDDIHILRNDAAISVVVCAQINYFHKHAARSHSSHFSALPSIIELIFIVYFWKRGKNGCSGMISGVVPK